MMAFVLFDLDNTLVDSLHLKALRDSGSWPAVYAKVNTVALFGGIAEMWQALRDRGLYLGIVTHSPRSYAKRVLDRVGLIPDALIAYHDLKGRRKPSPFGYECCAAGRPANEGLAVGDERPDLVAADAFGSTGVFAGWSRNPVLTADECAAAGWSFARAPSDVLDALDHGEN